VKTVKGNSVLIISLLCATLVGVSSCLYSTTTEAGIDFGHVSDRAMLGEITDMQSAVEQGVLAGRFSDNFRELEELLKRTKKERWRKYKRMILHFHPRPNITTEELNIVELRLDLLYTSMEVAEYTKDRLERGLKIIPDKDEAMLSKVGASFYGGSVPVDN